MASVNNIKFHLVINFPRGKIIFPGTKMKNPHDGDQASLLYQDKFALLLNER
jgi:hypothetical protein